MFDPIVFVAINSVFSLLLVKYTDVTNLEAGGVNVPGVSC